MTEQTENDANLEESCDTDVKADSDKPNSVRSSLNKGKALLEKAKARRQNKSGRESLDGGPHDSATSTSSATAMLSKVKKAASEATKNSVNKIAPLKKMSISSESGSDRVLKEEGQSTEPSNSDQDEDTGTSQSGTKLLKKKGSNVSEEFSKRVAPVVKFTQNIRNKRKSNTETDTEIQDTSSPKYSDSASKDVKVEANTDAETSSTAVVPNSSLEYSRGDSTLSQSSAAPLSGKRVDVGPVVSFLLRDSSIVIGTSLIVAVVPTILYWDSVVHNQIPLSVSLSWMLVAFLVGRELERAQGSGELLPGLITVESEGAAYEAIPTATTTVKSREVEELPKENHTIFMKATKNFNKVKFRLASQKAAKKPRKKFWTNLNSARQGYKSHWEKNIQAPKSRSLMTRMYKDPSLRRMSIEAVVDETIIVDDSTSQKTEDSAVGTFDLSTCTADTLADHVVEPIFELRGMDVFLTGEDGAEDHLGDHPFLLESGLRRKKTLLVNILLQWANVLIYFEMPDWVESLDSVVENEDDSDGVKALKRFINGNDEYRNHRLKIIPSLVDGPRIIKMLAPPKKELTVCSAILPVAWNKSNGTAEPDGTKNQPMMEVELDCMANKAMRGMANIVKRNLSGVTIDLAVIIQKPDGAVEEEPSACLGMWRFDKVDIDTCPMLPERKIKEEEFIRRASTMIGISPDAIAELNGME